jgi:hypothetical protein
VTEDATNRRFSKYFLFIKLSNIHINRVVKKVCTFSRKRKIQAGLT